MQPFGIRPRFVLVPYRARGVHICLRPFSPFRMVSVVTSAVVPVSCSPPGVLNPIHISPGSTHISVGDFTARTFRLDPAMRKLLQVQSKANEYVARDRDADTRDGRGGDLWKLDAADGAYEGICPVVGGEHGTK